MRGFELVKREDHWALYNEDGHKIAATLPGCKSKLSLKNCEAIANGYDFDEYQEGVFYAGQFGHPSPEGFSDEQVGRLHGFIDGFQKAIEILGDKKFNYGHLDKMFTCGKLYQDSKNEAYCFDNVLNKFQQTEWDVEIVTFTGDDLKSVSEDWGKIGQPKLDADGCLILKRI